MYTLTEILRQIDYSLIEGIFISLLVVIVFRLIFKNRLDTAIAFKILKWTIIVHGLGVILFAIFYFFFDDKVSSTVFIRRATGTHWWAYWLMITMNSLVPLLLLIKKLGNKIYFLLLVSVLINIGGLMESYIILITRLVNDNNSPNSFPAFIPVTIDLFIGAKAIVFGMVALLIGNLIKEINKYRSLKNGDYR